MNTMTRSLCAFAAAMLLGAVAIAVGDRVTCIGNGIGEYDMCRVQHYAIGLLPHTAYCVVVGWDSMGHGGQYVVQSDSTGPAGDIAFCAPCSRPIMIMPAAWRDSLPYADFGTGPLRCKPWGAQP